MAGSDRNGRRIDRRLTLPSDRSWAPPPDCHGAPPFVRPEQWGIDPLSDRHGLLLGACSEPSRQRPENTVSGHLTGTLRNDGGEREGPGLEQQVRSTSPRRQLHTVCGHSSHHCDRLPLSTRRLCRHVPIERRPRTHLHATSIAMPPVTHTTGVHHRQTRRLITPLPRTAAVGRRGFARRLC